ncbi:MAG: four helix bundle protein, partial [Bacteroidetes bacterium]
AIACKVYQKFPQDLKRVSSNQIASVDSIHRNIAEGYGRKSKLEYLRFLDYAMASLAEFTSGNHVYHEAKQISNEEFDTLDCRSYKLENGIRKLIISIRKKRNQDWNDTYETKEPRMEYPIISDSKETEKWEQWNEVTG